MGKNNYLINLQREFKRRIEHTVPLCYACIALALHREYGWGFTRINRLFVASQDIWQESLDNGVDMVQMCLEETGIECCSAVEQERAEREKNKRADKKKSYRKGTGRQAKDNRKSQSENTGAYS